MKIERGGGEEAEKCKTARCTLNLQIYSKVANERTIKNFEE